MHNGERLFVGLLLVTADDFLLLLASSLSGGMKVLKRSVHPFDLLLVSAQSHGNKLAGAQTRNSGHVSALAGSGDASGGKGLEADGVLSL